MIARVTGLVFVIGMQMAQMCLAVPSAVAGCSVVYVTEYVQGVAIVRAVKQCPDVTAQSGEEVVSTPQTSLGCESIAVGASLDPAEVCDQPEAITPQVLTPGMIAEVFRRIPLPPSELVIQPPNGRTLVNFETNFYTETEEFTRALTLLGQQVELRIWPAEFGWRFGDGEELWTAEAGAPYPDLEVTHNYLAKGDVAPSVDTRYAAEFRVGGGPWQPVPGTVTIPGASVALEVVEATPTLVG